MNRRQIWLFVLVFFPLWAFPASAETVTLTLDEAVQRALDQSINLKKGVIDLAQTQYSATHLYSEIFPSFSLNGGLNALPSTPLLTKPGFQYNNQQLYYSFNFGISFPLNPSFRSSMKRIELAYRSQLLQYDDARYQLEISVIKNFLSLATKKENIAYLGQSLARAEQKLINERAAWENGLLSELDWLRSQLGVETARYNMSAAQEDYQNSLADFLTTLGMDTGTDIIFKGTVEIIPLYYDPEELILEYLPKRPDIVMQYQTIESLELSKNITVLRNRAPTLNLSTQWQGGLPSNNTLGLGAPFADGISGSVSLGIPIDSWIPGTQLNQSISAADAAVEKAKLDLQDTETNAKTQIRSLISNLHNSWKSLAMARLQVEIAQHTLDAAQEGFNHGVVEFQDLEDRQKDLDTARQQLLGEELNYQNLFLDLAAALNVEWKTLTTRSLP